MGEMDTNHCKEYVRKYHDETLGWKSLRLKAAFHFARHLPSYQNQFPNIVKQNNFQNRFFKKGYSRGSAWLL